MNTTGIKIVKKEKIIPPNRCTQRNCYGIMKHGKAIKETVASGIPDFLDDDEEITMSVGGPGRLIDCWKCDRCGHSETMIKTNDKSLQK